MGVPDVEVQLEDGPFLYGGTVRGRIEFDPAAWTDGSELVLSLQAWRRVVQPISGKPATNHQLHSVERTFTPCDDPGGSILFEVSLPVEPPDWGYRVPRWLQALVTRLPFLADVGPLEWRLVASRLGAGSHAAVTVKHVQVG